MKTHPVTHSPHSEVLHNDQEQKIAALRNAIEEGSSSGYVEGFDFEFHLKKLKHSPYK